MIIRNEKFFAYFYYINNFVDSVLTNNDFSNSDLIFVYLIGATGEGNNFASMIADCVTLLEGHANEVTVC